MRKFFSTRLSFKKACLRAIDGSGRVLDYASPKAAPLGKRVETRKE